MEIAPTETEKQGLISTFLEIAVGQSSDTAVQFLQATSWKLEEAVQLFYVGSEGGGLPSASSSPPVPVPVPVRESHSGREGAEVNESFLQVIGDDGVRAPLPVKRETLYGGDASYVRQPSSVVAFRNFDEESKRPAVWESDQSSSSTTIGSRDNLASLYRPPFALMYNGPFDKAKIESSLQDKWLLVNLQSTEEFSSHMLNRDTWANEAVAQTIRTNFIFWQVYHDTSEGKKVCTYYNLVSIPAILVIDPITGQKMYAWSGMVQPERLLEDLLPFMDRGPKANHVVLPHKRPREPAENSALKLPAAVEDEEELLRAVAASMEGTKDSIATVEDDEELLRAVAASMEGAKGSISSPATDAEPEDEKDAEPSLKRKPTYPPLPEEPTGNRELLCKVGIRLPDGRRVQRNFLREDPIKFLWSFCCSLLDDGGARPFHFTEAIPGASKSLDYESDLTFDEASLSNSMISLSWD